MRLGSLSAARGLLLGLCLALSSVSVAACSVAPAESAAQSSELRSLTAEEALADFDQLASAFRSLYGALERKEAKYGFSFNTLVSEYRARVQHASRDAEYQGIFVEFVSRFKDAHVSLSPAFVGESAFYSDDSHAFRLPMFVMPVGGTFVVIDVGEAAGGQVKVGDEVLAIDGVDPETLVKGFLKYAGTPNALAARHFAAARLTGRAPYLSAGIHAGSTATLLLRDANGAERTAVLTWAEAPHALPPVASAPKAGESTRKTVMARSALAEDVVRAELTKFGARVPFFMTDAAKAQLGFEAASPKEATLTKYGVTPEAAAKVAYFAGTYRLDGKRVLFLRIPDYIPADEIAAVGWIMALFDDQQPNVDALLLDQTHNTGGSLFFAHSVASLLTSRPINGYVQKNHADRMWILSYANIAEQIREQYPEIADAIMSQAKKIDEAYSARRSHAEAQSLFASDSVIQPEAVHWEKPMLMLVDELSVSCGDIVPALIKGNRVAPLFGQTTMGGGGNVEEVATLTNTRWTLNVSRGLGTVFDPTGAYPEAAFVEDNGVKPDTLYAHTLSDFRAGYVGYVKAFNTALAAQLAPAASAR